MADDARGSAGGQGGTDPFSGCLVRLGWTFGAGIGLLSLTILIARHPPWSFGARDVAFWGVFAAAIGLRYLDVARFGGRTFEGERATLRDVRRYALALTAVSALSWILAQSIQFAA